MEKDHTGPMGAFLKRMQPFLDGVESFDNVISPIASLEPHGIGSILWGSVKGCIDVSPSFYSPAYQLGN